MPIVYHILTNHQTGRILIDMHIGEIIKKFRKEKRMTLAELSRKSGVALATLSRIENARMTGTLKSHIRICDALGIAITDLYGELPSAKKVAEVKTKEADRRISIHDRRSSSVMLASNIEKKKMLPVLITIAGGARTGAGETSHGVEKFAYVLSGKVEANIGENRYGLSAGDSIYFDSSASHYFRNSGSGEARLISVSSQPSD